MAVLFHHFLHRAVAHPHDVDAVAQCGYAFSVNGVDVSNVRILVSHDSAHSSRDTANFRNDVL